MSKMLGEVDLFGLDRFGVSAEMDSVYGALIGGSAAGLGGVLADKTGNSKLRTWASIGAGAAAAGIMWKSHKYKGAALGALAGTAAVTLVPMVINWIFYGGSSAPMSGLGIPQVEYLNGLGIPQVEYLNGLGLPSIAGVPKAYGTIPGVAGIAGPQLGTSAHPPVDLLGAMSPQAHQVELMGGPTISGLASAYGATLLGPQS